MSQLKSSLSLISMGALEHKLQYPEEKSKARKLALCILLSVGQLFDTTNGEGRRHHVQARQLPLAEDNSPDKNVAVSTSNQHSQQRRTEALTC